LLLVKTTGLAAGELKCLCKIHPETKLRVCLILKSNDLNPYF